jgi:predicted amidohydrolase
MAWEALLKARAIENQAYCIGVNRVGKDGNGHSYVGNSQVVSFDGTVLLHADSEEGLFQATLDMESLAKFRKNFPAWQDADAFTLTNLY